MEDISGNYMPLTRSFSVVGLYTFSSRLLERHNVSIWVSCPNNNNRHAVDDPCVLLPLPNGPYREQQTPEVIRNFRRRRWDFREPRTSQAWDSRRNTSLENRGKSLSPIFSLFLRRGGGGEMDTHKTLASKSRTNRRITRTHAHSAVLPSARAWGHSRYTHMYPRQDFSQLLHTELGLA